MISTKMPTKGKVDVVASASVATAVWKVKLTPNYTLPDRL